MFSKFFNKFNQKKQSRDNRLNIHENWFSDANSLADNSTKHFCPPKEVSKQACFIQEDDPNIFTIPESRNSKYETMHYFSEY